MALPAPVPVVSGGSRRSSPAWIRRSDDYRRVLADGARTTGGLVIAYVQVTGHPTRAGVVCSRRVGGAVVRNRARRLLKEAWRGLSPRVRAGFDLVVVARPEIRGAGLGPIRSDLAATLTAGGVMDE